MPGSRDKHHIVRRCLTLLISETETLKERSFASERFTLRSFCWKAKRITRWFWKGNLNFTIEVAQKMLCENARVVIDKVQLYYQWELSYILQKIWPKIQSTNYKSFYLSWSMKFISISIKVDKKERATKENFSVQICIHYSRQSKPCLCLRCTFSRATIKV